MPVNPDAAAGELNGAMDARALETLSSTMATSSGKVRSACQSSNPSRHTSESKVMAPTLALERSSLNRMGPTGTPLIPTYHSSAGTVNSLKLGDSGAATACVNAPAKAPTGSETRVSSSSSENG